MSDETIHLQKVYKKKARKNSVIQFIIVAKIYARNLMRREQIFCSERNFIHNNNLIFILILQFKFYSKFIVILQFGFNSNLILI